MNERDPSSQQSKIKVAVHSDSIILSEGEELAVWAREEGAPQTRGEALRAKFEAKYNDHLSHARQIQQSEPDASEDPDGYNTWVVSRDYMNLLRKDQPKIASRVRRLVMPINQRINQRAVELEEFREEFGDLIPPVPAERIVKQKELVDAVEYYEDKISDIGYEYNMLDINLQNRTEGVAYTFDGTPAYHPGDPAVMAEWQQSVTDLNSRIAELRKKQEEYLKRLPEGKKESLYNKRGVRTLRSDI